MVLFLSQPDPTIIDVSHAFARPALSCTLDPFSTSQYLTTQFFLEIMEKNLLQPCDRVLYFPSVLPFFRHFAVCEASSGTENETDYREFASRLLPSR